MDGERRHRQRGARLEGRLEQRRYDPAAVLSEPLYDEWQTRKSIHHLECVALYHPLLTPGGARRKSRGRRIRDEKEKG